MWGDEMFKKTISILMETKQIPETRQIFILKKENKNELWKMKSLIEGL